MTDSTQMKADYAVVVSFAKSGTNLVANLMRQLGYTCVGHGIRDSYDELSRKLGELESNAENAAEGFSRPDTMLRALKNYPKHTCLFVHRMHIGPHLLEWCNTLEPKMFFNYRDPRDSLISMVNYLLLKANDHYTEMPWNMIYAKTLASLGSTSEQMMFAIRHMSSHTTRYREHVWLLHHPSVCKLSYEELVGPRGGGNENSQAAAVSRVMEHLGVEGEPKSYLDRFYDPNSRTFHRGRIGDWKDTFGEQHSQEFATRYADILATYGYADGAPSSVRRYG